MAVKQISATARTQVGKGAARAVRRAGQVPAVIYGADQAPTPIALDANATNLLVYAGHFLTTVFEVDVAGQKTRVVPRDYQLDPVKDTVTHVDFLRVGAGTRIRVEIPVHVVGSETSPGVKGGGAVNLVTHALELLVSAENIPTAIDVDISALNINESIHASEIKLPQGATPVSHEDFTVATIAPPLEEIVDEVPDAADVEAAADSVPADKGGDE